MIGAALKKQLPETIKMPIELTLIKTQQEYDLKFSIIILLIDNKSWLIFRAFLEITTVSLSVC